MGEFELIERYFKRQQQQQAALGIGDDCALLQPKPNSQIAISCDMLVAGRHFFADVDPYSLGHKALAVNLSDLAACGAQPLAFSLALSLPAVDEVWLAAFARGLLNLAAAHQCQLIGGDTCCGPLNICISVFGQVALQHGNTQALLRSGAKAGDDIYVSGQLGDARLALNALQGKIKLPTAILQTARLRLELPTPRLALALALVGTAHAAIDVSDGLLGDLQHILHASNVGACIQADSVSHLVGARAQAQKHGLTLSDEQWRELALAGGDDYELLFTAAPSRRKQVAQAALDSQTPVARIGTIEVEPGLRLLDQKGQLLTHHYAAFDHFA